jgi:hypothetical protein
MFQITSSLALIVFKYFSFLFGSGFFSDDVNGSMLKVNIPLNRIPHTREKTFNAFFIFTTLLFKMSHSLIMIRIVIVIY